MIDAFPKCIILLSYHWNDTDRVQSTYSYFRNGGEEEWIFIVTDTGVVMKFRNFYHACEKNALPLVLALIYKRI